VHQQQAAARLAVRGRGRTLAEPAVSQAQARAQAEAGIAPTQLQLELDSAASVVSATGSRAAPPRLSLSALGDGREGEPRGRLSTGSSGRARLSPTLQLWREALQPPPPAPDFAPAPALADSVAAPAATSGAAPEAEAEAAPSPPALAPAFAHGGSMWASAAEVAALEPEAPTAQRAQLPATPLSRSSLHQQLQQQAIMASHPRMRRFLRGDGSLFGNSPPVDSAATPKVSFAPGHARDARGGRPAPPPPPRQR
jgi:hypothetical protein